MSTTHDAGNVSAPDAGRTTTDRTGEATRQWTAVPGSLPTLRLNVMRIGYLVMGIGLAPGVLGDSGSASRLRRPQPC